jgi:hypothetical protein
MGFWRWLTSLGRRDPTRALLCRTEGCILPRGHDGSHEWPDPLRRPRPATEMTAGESSPSGLPRAGQKRDASRGRSDGAWDSGIWAGGGYDGGSGHCDGGSHGGDCGSSH